MNALAREISAGRPGAALALVERYAGRADRDGGRAVAPRRLVNECFEGCE